jgi:hypothetical protein
MFMILGSGGCLVRSRGRKAMMEWVSWQVLCFFYYRDDQKIMRPKGSRCQEKKFEREIFALTSEADNLPSGEVSQTWKKIFVVRLLGCWLALFFEPLCHFMNPSNSITAVKKTVSTVGQTQTTWRRKRSFCQRRSSRKIGRSRQSAGGSVSRISSATFRVIFVEF